ncbi:MAG: hypothetical protein M3396_00030 [Actinomycetota bacterium]|nr:hypothetical protein [Actinomycetota bacterium]
MAQPDYVPLSSVDRVRPSARLPPPRRWFQDRPAEVGKPGQPMGGRFGVPGPDQGYGMLMAEQFEDRLELAEGERAEDAISGCVGVGLRRAALYGRAPTKADMELAFTVWGFLGDAPAELVELRKPFFQGAAKAYLDLRAIVDRVAESALRLSPAQARELLISDWRSLFTS